MKSFFKCIVLFMSVLTVQAHESRPLHIEINETAANTFSAQWKVPPSVPDINRPTIGLGGCKNAGEAFATRGPGGTSAARSSTPALCR